MDSRAEKILFEKLKELPPERRAEFEDFVDPQKCKPRSFASGMDGRVFARP